jgi:hypothetical protein
VVVNGARRAGGCGADGFPAGQAAGRVKGQGAVIERDCPCLRGHARIHRVASRHLRRCCPACAWALPFSLRPWAAAAGTFLALVTR